MEMKRDLAKLKLASGPMTNNRKPQGARSPGKSTAFQIFMNIDVLDPKTRTLGSRCKDLMGYHRPTRLILLESGQLPQHLASCR